MSQHTFARIVFFNCYSFFSNFEVALSIESLHSNIRYGEASRVKRVPGPEECSLWRAYTVV